ncbi:MAG: NADH-quinone oxidoreductase subunit A [Holosporales bacterium]|nr:NADH-quinone oxidoreductase subunit A [Holosporales bacterium]
MVILLAGLIAVCAIVISRITVLLPKINSNGKCSSYECGFDGSNDSEFVYVHEHNGAVSLFVVIELAMLWLLVCCLLCVTYSNYFGSFSTKILALILAVLLRVVVSVGLKTLGY